MSLFVAVLFVSAQAASAAPPAPPAQTTPAAPAPKKEKKICKADDASSGSRMAKRVCLTEDEWAQRGKGMINNSRSGFSGAPATEDH